MTLFVRHYVVFALCLGASIWLEPPPVSAQGLDIEEGRAHFEAQRFEEAFRIIGPLATEGNAEAQFLLGVVYENRPGHKLYNAPRSLNWYLKAADSGHICARRRLIEILLFQGRIRNKPPDGDLLERFHLTDGPTDETYKELLNWEYSYLERNYYNEKFVDKMKDVHRRRFVVMLTWYRTATERGLLHIANAAFQFAYSFKHNELLISEKLSEAALSGEFWRWFEELQVNWPTKCRH